MTLAERIIAHVTQRAADYTSSSTRHWRILASRFFRIELLEVWASDRYGYAVRSTQLLSWVLRGMMFEYLADRHGQQWHDLRVAGSCRMRSAGTARNNHVIAERAFWMEGNTAHATFGAKPCFVLTVEFLGRRIGEASPQIIRR